MHVSDFEFNLPETLIARYPASERTASRLLVVNGADGRWLHGQFSDLIDYLRLGDLLVLNDSQVIPARLLAKKKTGARVEILVERILEHPKVLAHMRSNKSLKIGTVLFFSEKISAQIIDKKDNLFILYFNITENMYTFLEQYGRMPLPPYIKRLDEEIDKTRYQTVYARRKGSVASPTAGLHFNHTLLQALQNKGVEVAYVTLHIGAGTFAPIKTEDVAHHHMHSEYVDVSSEVCQKVCATQARGGRVVAVGTTSVRCLETASQSGILRPYQGETTLFIYPGYVFQNIDLLLTNFHLPRSTLLMLVSAFAGKETIKKAYEAAICEQYRFFSYGDAMLLSRKGSAL